MASAGPPLSLAGGLVNAANAMPSRPCDYQLYGECERGSVFIDFGETPDKKQVRLLRISFDGYGCCSVDKGPNRMPAMSEADSNEFRRIANENRVSYETLAPLLKRYFGANIRSLWDGALQEYHLL
eukprot:TRINITY_DN2934_c0_g1_i2.p1 TRINITY_DN2934_c0_g1~~TRINITY_DN2934_c0_g1_i2.p1  ORF type:complete len:126 (-),score=13.36 TRINITY_DN2934_c0_g1_i2:4-381(-)